MARGSEGALPDGLVDTAFQRYDEIQRQRVRSLYNLHRAVFAESLVAASLPGSKLSTDPAHSHDITWRRGGSEIRIEVKCSGGYLPRYGDERETPPKWSFPIQKLVWNAERGKRVPNAVYQFDVIVLARHVGSDLNAGWRFHVLNSKEATTLRGRARGSIGERFPHVDARELAASVKAAFRRL